MENEVIGMNGKEMQDMKKWGAWFASALRRIGHSDAAAHVENRVRAQEAQQQDRIALRTKECELTGCEA